MIFARWKNERGQAFVLTAIAMVMVCGMAALVLDVGNWFRDKRRLQGTADAAALAGAQRLPTDPAGAKNLAQSYANDNGGDVAGANIVISSTYSANDTIAVKAQRNDPGIFSRVVGKTSATITANAKARVGIPQQARWVAPIGVNQAQEFIKGTAGCPCFNKVTTLALGKAAGGARKDAPGAFNMLNLDGTKGGIGPGTLADWMLRGYDGYLGLGEYYSDPGAKYNSAQMEGALAARKNTTLLFPVYDKLTGNGANAKYNVVGWIGFYMTDFDTKGSSGTLTGYFTEYIAQGFLSQTSAGVVPNFGVTAIQLIE
jgi:Flp pilus assembly protein TadG